MLVVNLLEILKMCRCGPLKGFSLRSSEILTNNLIQFINTSLMSKELLLGYIHEYKFEHHVFLFCNILRIGRQPIFKQFIYLKLNAMQQYSINEI